LGRQIQPLKNRSDIRFSGETILPRRVEFPNHSSAYHSEIRQLSVHQQQKNIRSGSITQNSCVENQRENGEETK